MLFLIPLVVVGVIAGVLIARYKTSSYYKSTHNSFMAMDSDVGKRGEYFIYQELRCFEKQNAKLLFNIYVPKQNQETTEIDALMISSKGIFVFESKNYSGWIFGKEDQKYWYQTLPQGKGQSHKERFYNPIWQNRAHIKYLKQIIGDEIPVYSLVVFSDRCELKSIPTDCDTLVLQRQDLKETIAYAEQTFPDA